MSENSNQIAVFVINTPFQKWVANTINLQFTYECVYYIITYSKDVDVQPEVSNVSSIYINNIINLYAFKSLIKKIDQINREFPVDYFFPHMNNLFSSIFYYTFKGFSKAKFNFYYEGIAMFYDPVVKISAINLLKRRISGLLLNRRYIHDSRLFPVAIKANATAFTPVPELTAGFKGIAPFSFQGLAVKSPSESLLILGYPLKTIEAFKEFEKKIIPILEEYSSFSSISFKPHFETERRVENLLKLLFAKFSVQMLNSYVPVEVIYQDTFFNRVISFNLSSSLVNLKSVYGRDIQLLIVEKTANKMLQSIYEYLNK